MKMPPMTYIGKAGDFRPIRSMITISGNNEVLIENCKKLIECCDIRCSAESAGYLIDIWGSGLTATSFANGSIGVCGEVQSVAIEKKSRTGSVK